MQSGMSERARRDEQWYSTGSDQPQRAIGNREPEWSQRDAYSRGLAQSINDALKEGDAVLRVRHSSLRRMGTLFNG